MHTSKHRLLLLMLFCIGCQAVEDGISSTDTGTSGIQGRMMRGPMCPAIDSAEPCPDAPLSASFDVFDSRGQRVARFDSDEQGHFKVALAPGVYTIVPAEDAPLIQPTLQKEQVEVSASQFVEVTLRFDTGIR